MDIEAFKEFKLQLASCCYCLSMAVLIVICLKDRHSAYIRQLFPTSTPLGRIKLKVFGNSGVGKSTLIESLKCGYFSNLLRKAGITSSPTNMSAVPLKGGSGMEKLRIFMTSI